MKKNNSVKTGEKIKFATVKLIPYFHMVDIVITPKHSDALALFDKIYKPVSNEYGTGPMAHIRKTVKGCERLLIKLKDGNVGDMAHEAVHTSWFLDNAIKLNFDQVHDEQQAYLVGFIVEECIKVFKSKPKTIRQIFRTYE